MKKLKQSTTIKQQKVIQLKEVWKTYQMGNNQIHALKGINFEINKGDFIAIIGKSGSGKTTCVNQIGCLDKPTKGQIILDGTNISKLSENQLAKIRGKKIGYIFQKFNLLKNLTALENVMLPMTFQSIPLKQRKQKAHKLLCEFEMQERENFKPTQLSGGQQQRIAIARALANDPQIILADEPTGNLDTKTGKIVFKYLQKLNNQGKTIILVTHDEDLAKQAKKTLILKDGQITN